MIVTIITTTFKRPILLKRLGNSIIPLLNMLDGKLKWRVIIDELNHEYKAVIEKMLEKIHDKSLFVYSDQENTGKFKTLVDYINKESESDWLVSIDDDDVLIDYKFRKIMNQLSNIEAGVKAVLLPILILNISFFSIFKKMKKKLFNKYNNKKLSFYDFKQKFGDVDTTMFIRPLNNKIIFHLENSNESFTAESLFYLNAFPKDDILIINDNIVYSQYLSQGLTKYSRINRILNPISAAATYKMYLDQGKTTFSILYIKSLINFFRFSLHARKNVNLIKEIHASLPLRYFGYFFGKLYFYYDNLFFKKK